MKKISVLILLLWLSVGCGSYNSIDQFYNAHKNDDQVLAIRVPRVMLTLLSESSPEMNSLLGTTKDLRFMQFPSTTTERTRFLNQQMNSITGNSFIEVFRKNEDLKRHVVSIRERGNTVKEILFYNNNAVNGSFLYFNGNFDPVKVRNMAKNGAFEDLEERVRSQFNPMGAATPND